MRSAILGLVLLAMSSPAFADWHVATSNHFVIYADEKPETLKEFAFKLEKFDQAVRIVRGMDDPPLGNAGRLTVYVLKNSDAVSKLAVGKSTTIAGFYVPRASGSVAFVPDISGSRARREDAEVTFFHEYAHHLMLQNATVAYPAWMVEGFAEFFSTADFNKDGSVSVGTPANHRAYGLFALGKPRIEDVLSASFDAGTAEQLEVLYGRSWLLTHYLAFNTERHGQDSASLRAINAGEDPLGAARAAFGDLDELDHELDSYLRRNRFRHLTVEGPALNVTGVQIRKMRDGEARVMPVRIRSARGVSKDSAAEVAATARATAAAFPNEAAVQTALAEAEYDHGNYAAAEAAADRALKADPNAAQAMIYKGRALMELATANPETADWRAIRSWFTRANRLDPEDAEPLMLFYESFRAAGERPTANAVKGLRYAFLLTPQDSRLRMMAVTELLNEQKYAEARRALAPLAYSPHAGGGSEEARAMMEALGKSDPEAALRQLYASESGAD